MQKISELSALVNFLEIFAIFLIPCIMGSAVAYLIKLRSATQSKKRKKTKFTEALGTIVLNSVTPSVILTTVDILVPDETFRTNGIYLCAAVLLGAVGEDITKFFLNIKNTIAVIKSLTSKVDTLKDLADTISVVEKDDDDKEE